MKLSLLHPYLRILFSGLFDHEYYLTVNLDVKISGMDPLLHYLIHGWRENRNPSREFDAFFYLSTYPEIKKANLNPLLDYIQRGRKEGRRISDADTGANSQVTRRSSLVGIKRFLRYQYNRQTPKKLRTTLTTPINKEDGADKYINAYTAMLDNAQNSPQPTFIPFEKFDPGISNDHTRIIAMYLPQFHPIPENDEWWGKGFTEWTNVSKACPQFLGHYQPHLPGELGFYDLRIFNNIEKQVQLARNYGVEGFCFHYYWFNGKKMLEKPIEAFLRSDLDFPFCICWANENWTRGWEGRDHVTLIGQDHTIDVAMKFIHEIKPILEDPRYIRINGRPLLIVYRTSVFDDPKAVANGWRDYCVKEQIGNPYLVAVQTYGFFDPRPIGFDAALQFPPLNHIHKDVKDQFIFLNKNFSGEIFSYREMSKKFLGVQEKDYPLIRAVCPGWDNEARKPGRGSVFHGSTPAAYENWLEQAIIGTEQHHPQNERFVFVNAWNEWAEGAHLEPDRKFGYGFLNATRRALRQVSELEIGTRNGLINVNKISRRNDTAVILHVYYQDLFAEISEYLKNIKGFDLYVSLPQSLQGFEDEIWKSHPEARILKIPNRGRDIFPFLQILKIIFPLGYKDLLKIHTKKTPHREDGIEWRKDIFGKLLGSFNNVENIRGSFHSDPNIGLIGASGHLLSSRYHLGINDEKIRELARSFQIENLVDYQFPAGTMFWARPSSMLTLCTLPLNISDFEEEPIDNDGTLVHALERMLGLVIVNEGYKIFEVNTDGQISQCDNKRTDYQFA